MIEILEARERKKAFYWSSGVFAVLILLIRFFVLPATTAPTFLSVIAGALDVVFGALVGSVAVTSLILWLTPPPKQRGVIDVVFPFRIEQTLEEASGLTDEWWYRGHSGRHFRAVTLPRMATRARSANVTKKVVVQILDPTQESVCEYYASYRRSLRSAPRDRLWTLERVRRELYATIVSTYARKAQEPLLDITVALIDRVSLFRVDLSTRLAIITKEDPQEPALRFDQGTLFYDSYKEDLRLSLQQARALPNGVVGAPLAQLQQGNVADLLQRLGIRSPTITDEDIREIIGLVNKSENPYA